MQFKLNGSTLVITCELTEPVISSTGKTFIIASSHGIVHTGLQKDGKPISVSLNAVIPNPDFKKAM